MFAVQAPHKAKGKSTYETELKRVYTQGTDNVQNIKYADAQRRAQLEHVKKSVCTAKSKTAHRPQESKSPNERKKLGHAKPLKAHIE